ncbi:helix-turn-helix domain-containing protein [Paenibacillus popilliae]|uniref:Uncharacterized protein n=1 Tax=Paenibacillus popilliae ATCC 14706 TaxID=1212764 RepID=M9LHG1_PAEPP|nr:helix-turn-helix domain-containing protein [Paenibacillus popilliae]GAC42225.1 hypothetical protein PPOP_1582 [Paenibacillus popilliae ATCC 14706]
MPKLQDSASEKLVVLQEIESGQIGIKAAAKKSGISKTSLAKWRRPYEVYGYGTRPCSFYRKISAQSIPAYHIIGTISPL